MIQKKWISLIVVFVAVTIGALAAGDWLTANGVDTAVLLGGNALLFGASMLALKLYDSAMKSSKNYGFVKQVYAGFMIKFFVLVVGAMVYFYFAKEVNKPAIFICMLLYLIYNFLGTSQVVKKPMEKQAPHHAASKHHKAGGHKRRH